MVQPGRSEHILDALAVFPKSISFTELQGGMRCGRCRRVLSSARRSERKREQPPQKLCVSFFHLFLTLSPWALVALHNGKPPLQRGCGALEDLRLGDREKRPPAAKALDRPTASRREVPPPQYWP